MFRRPHKNPLDESVYQQEESPAPYGHYNGTSAQEQPPMEPPPRIFDAPSAQSMATPFPTEMAHEEPTSTHIPHHFQELAREEEPETTLGEGVTFRGELSFERLLRIDGTFEGELLSQGKVIVGPKGVVKANLHLREAIVEGVIEGDITVQERLELRGGARIDGDIIARSLVVDEGVSIDGRVRITPSEPIVPDSEY